MRVLILGATGMLGHKLAQCLAESFDVVGSVRSDSTKFANHPILGDLTLKGHVCADNFSSVKSAINSVKPDCVVNCIGIVKQLPSAQDAIASITINALFPHQLAQYGQGLGIRVIHYSTDCVFSGNKGMYTEEDAPDAEDLYGRTKYLGEIEYDNCLTLRTSVIGRELGNPHGLIDWFLSQDGNRVKGYNKAIFSGLTTKAHGELLKLLLTQFQDLNGVRHLAADPIDKYSLLNLVKKTYGLDIEIEQDESIKCDRSLDSAKLRKITGITPPSWEEMISEMFHDEKTYAGMR